MDIKEKTLDIDFSRQIQAEAKEFSESSDLHIENIQEEFLADLGDLKLEIDSMVQDMQQSIREHTESVCQDIAWDLESLNNDAPQREIQSDVREMKKEFQQDVNEMQEHMKTTMEILNDKMDIKIELLKDRSDLELSAAIDEIIQQAKNDELTDE